MKKEEILKFYEKFKLYIFPSVVVLSSAVLIFSIIYPQTMKLLDTQQEIFRLQNQVKFMEDKLQTLSGLNFDDLAIKLKFALNSYPDNKDLVNSIQLLQNIVTQAGFNVSSLSVGSAGLASGDQAQSYGIKLDSLGPIAKLPVLLNNIESSYRLMRVSSLETSAGKESLATASINVVILYKTAPPVAGSLDSPLPKLSEEEQNILGKLTTVGNIVDSEQEAFKQTARGRLDPFE